MGSDGAFPNSSGSETPKICYVQRSRAIAFPVRRSGLFFRLHAGQDLHQNIKIIKENAIFCKKKFEVRSNRVNSMSVAATHPHGPESLG
jgi:hypothetical protein